MTRVDRGSVCLLALQAHFSTGLGQWISSNWAGQQTRICTGVSYVI